MQRLSFIKTELSIPLEQRFIPFNLFLVLQMRLASLRPVILMITFLGLLLFIQWQSWMFEGSIAMSNLSKILMDVSSRSSLLILSGALVISKLNVWNIDYSPNTVSLMQPHVRATCYLHFLRQITLIQFFWSCYEVRLVLC